MKNSIMLILFSVVLTKASDLPNQLIIEYKQYFSLNHNDISEYKEIDRNIFYEDKTDFLVKFGDKFLYKYELSGDKKILSRLKIQKKILEFSLSILQDQKEKEPSTEIETSTEIKEFGKKDEIHLFDINDYYEYSITSPWQSKGIIRKNNDV